MKRFHSNVSSRKSTLQERPEIFHAVGVYAAIYILHRVIDNLMFVFIFQTAISAKFIGEKSSSGFHVPLDDGMQSGLNTICDNLCANATTALQHSHDDDLVMSGLSLSGDTASFYALVHIPRFSADEGFICLDFATEFRAKRFVLHCKANPMKHDPCRLLSDFNVARNLVAADSVLAVSDHPSCDHPLIQRNRGIFHDGSNLDGELALGMMS